MLEWLKAILGDGYSEEIDRRVSEEIERTLMEQQDEMARLKLDCAVDIALAAAGAKNVKTVKALLDLAEVRLGEDGRLSGFDEQLKAVRRSDGYLFAEKPLQNFKGFQPEAAADGVPDSEQGSYEARLAQARRDNNQAEVIRIKQEAAAEGVVLL